MKWMIQHARLRSMLKKTPWRAALALCAAGFLILNIVAFMHARAMTHYVSEGRRTDRPDQLSSWEKVKVLFTGVTLPRPINRRFPSDDNLPFETVMLNAAPGVRLEAWRIAATAEPARGIVIMFGGYGSGKFRLIGDAVRFREMGFETLLVDFRGAGGSSGNVTTIGMREGEDVAAAGVYARGKAGGRPVIAYGRSMGSAAILTAAARHGFQPDAMILESPFDTLLKAVENRFGLMGLPAFPLARMLVLWGGVQNGCWGFGNRPMDFAREVTCPALVLNGGADRYATRKDAGRVFENLAGPKQSVVFEDCGHQAMSRCDEALWIETVGEFLDTYFPSSGID